MDELQEYHQAAMAAGFILRVDCYNSPNLYQCGACAALVVDFKAHQLWHYRLAENINGAQRRESGL